MPIIVFRVTEGISGPPVQGMEILVDPPGISLQTNTQGLASVRVPRGRISIGARAPSGFVIKPVMQETVSYEIDTTQYREDITLEKNILLERGSTAGGFDLKTIAIISGIGVLAFLYLTRR